MLPCDSIQPLNDLLFKLLDPVKAGLPRRPLLHYLRLFLDGSLHSRLIFALLNISIIIVFNFEVASFD